MTSTGLGTYETSPTALGVALPGSGARSHRLRWIARRLGTACFLLWIASPLAAGERFYVDLKGGRADFERGFGRSHPWAFDDDTSSLSVALGADLHPNLAIEIGFQAARNLKGLGSPCSPSPETLCITAIAEVEADLDLWTLTVVPKKSFGRFTVLGRIGAGYSEQDISATGPISGYLGELTDTELLFGAGARFGMTPRLELLIDYDHIEVGLETLRLGLGMRF